MKCRLFSLLLCLAILLPQFSLSASALTPAQAADVDGDGAVTARDAAILARYNAGWEGYVDKRGRLTYPWRTGPRTDGKFVKSFDPDQPVDFGGYTFRVLTRAGEADGTRELDGETVPKFKTTHFSVMDVCPWLDGSWSDYGGYAKRFTKLSAAVAQRNAYLEETYHCSIEEIRVSDPFGELHVDLFSGSCSYDLAAVSVGLTSPMLNMTIQSQVTFGLYENVMNIPTVDITKEWYEEDIIRGVACGDAAYFLTGASDSTLRHAVFLPVIGLKTVKEAYGLTDEKAAGNFIYDLVLNGDWTVDKLIEVGTTCFNAYSDKTNKWLYSATGTSNITHAVGAGFSAYNPETRQLYSSFADCPGSDAFVKLKGFLSDEGHRTTTENAAITGGLSGSSGVIRAIGVPTYCNGSAYDSTSTNNWMAFLPFPKGSAAQEHYITQPNNGFCCMYVIPTANRAGAYADQYGFESGKDMEGYFISAFMEASLARHNTLGYDLKDAVIEQLSERRSFHNADFVSPEYPEGKPKAALRMIFDGLTLDFCFIYTSPITSVFSITGGVAANWDTLSSRYATAYNQQQRYLNKMLDFSAMDR